MIYLRYFNNHNGYSQAVSDKQLEYPNVSICDEDLHVHYGEYPPFEPEFVDLGLNSRTLWAKMNIGASTPSEPGELYKWGELEPTDVGQDYADSATPEELNGLVNAYRFGYVDATNETPVMTKYAAGEYLELKDDVAYVRSNGLCRIPLPDEVSEISNAINDKILSVQYVAASGSVPAGIWVYNPGMGMQATDGVYFPMTIVYSGSKPMVTDVYWTNQVGDSGDFSAYSMTPYYENSEYGISGREGFRFLGSRIRPVKVGEGAGKTNEAEIKEYIIEKAIEMNPDVPEQVIRDDLSNRTLTKVGIEWRMRGNGGVYVYNQYRGTVDVFPIVA
jgi:hypothetical protein